MSQQKPGGRQQLCIEDMPGSPSVEKQHRASHQNSSVRLEGHLCAIAKSIEMIKARFLVAASMTLPIRLLLDYVAAAFGT